MGGAIRAVALDLDGTIATDDRVDPLTLAALEEAGSQGLGMMLVTGRITEDLDRHFPDLHERFDAVVSENGAVLGTAQGRVVLGHLADSLRSRLSGDPAFRFGRAIVECDAAEAARVLDLIGELGVDAQILRNRSRLMVLPAGVSKGSGLRAAAHVLGLSCHNVMAVGDAQNDLSLLDAAEIGVAVGNAVPSLKASADLVLAEPDGAGVRRLLASGVLDGSERLLPARRLLEIGTFQDGSAATVPAAQANLVIHGASGTGKSHLAGLLVERLVAQEYSVVVIDVEGDYHGLAHLSEVVMIDGSEHATAIELVTLMRSRGVSLVIDLSQVSRDEARSVAQELLGVLAAERAAWGVPHWLVVDEAQTSLPGPALDALARLAHRGVCLVTWRPKDLPATVLDAMDSQIRIERTGAAILIQDGVERPFVMLRRQTPHLRHWHKYFERSLPEEKWFRFRDPDGHALARAENVAEFLHLVQTLGPGAIGHHLLRGDFSRWLSHAIQDQGLGALAARIEGEVIGTYTGEVDRARGKLVTAIQALYRPESPGSASG